MTEGDLEEWFDQHEDVGKFIGSSEGLKLAKQLVNVKKQSGELREHVARRLYALRCRVVHTKMGDGPFDLLLPFSEETVALEHDIAIIEFAAQRALIAGGRRLGT